MTDIDYDSYESLTNFLTDVDLLQLEARLRRQGYNSERSLWVLTDGDIDRLLVVNVDCSEDQKLRFKECMEAFRRQWYSEWKEFKDKQNTATNPNANTTNQRQNTNLNKPQLAPVSSLSAGSENTKEGGKYESSAHGTTNKSPNATNTNQEYDSWADFGICKRIVLIFLFIIGISTQIVLTLSALSSIYDILSEISEYPFWGVEDEDSYVVKGWIAIGQHSKGFLSIGQISTGIISIGQVSVGLFTIGQASIGLIFTICQVGCSLGYAVFQVGIATYIRACQIGIGVYKTRTAQMGFSVIASYKGKSEMTVACGGGGGGGGSYGGAGEDGGAGEGGGG